MACYAKRILCLTDLSAVGRCSLSVSAPAITALGAECVMLPTALLSTHTGGFGDVAAMASGGFCGRALEHYAREGVEFDVLYSGWMCTPKAAEAVKHAFLRWPHALKIADPSCADGGKVYSSLSGEMIMELREIAREADVITPNLTEAKLLCAERYDAVDITGQELEALCAELAGSCCRMGVVTGARTERGWFNAVYSGGNMKLIPYEHCEQSYPGTGDLFTSILAALAARGADLMTAATFATKLTTKAVQLTASMDREPRFGLALEELMPELVSLKEYIDENKKR